MYKPTTPKKHQPLASIPEAFNYTRLSESTIRRAIKNGELPASKICGRIRIRWTDIEAFIARGTVAPSS
jgi:excisionase family DNA binding protein